MPQVHGFVSPKAEGSDSTIVGPNEWNADHNLSLQDGAQWVDPGRTTLTGTERLTMAGASRVTIQPERNLFLIGAYGFGSLQLIDGQWLLQYKRASLAGSARATLSGASDLFIFDFAPVNRLVLVGGPS